ncbi:MAG TPA: efflux RND transporter periplasmic adaptor subunit [Methylomirabilota bacterium]|jgi:HlyD family secretion protein|nr:efflux RND transporter periplasmic adaptor subunit [Methylomirabilota bacterium]
MSGLGKILRGSLVLVILLIAGAGVGLWALSRRDSTGAGLKVTGTMEATQVDIGAKTTARIRAIRVEEGQRVRRGDLLILLDDDQLRAELARLEAAVQVAQAQLKDLLAGARPEEIRAARQAVVQAEARLRDLEAGARQQEIEQARQSLASAQATREWAEKEYQRFQRLLDQGLVAVQDRDRTWQALEVARAQERAARQQLELLLAGPRPQQVEAARAEVRQARERLQLIEAGPRPGQAEAARAQVAQAEAALAEAKARLADTRIDSPADGVVLRKNLEPGATATPGTPIVTLVNPGDLWLRGYIAETDLGRVRVGQAARITVDAFPGRPFDGRVSEIASEAEFTPRNVQTQKERVNLVFRVKITVANPDGRLKPGMPADAVILVD